MYCKRVLSYIPAADVKGYTKPLMSCLRESLKPLHYMYLINVRDVIIAGVIINNYYFPALLVVGIIGNIVSFLVD